MKYYPKIETDAFDFGTAFGPANSQPKGDLMGKEEPDVLAWDFSAGEKGVANVEWTYAGGKAADPVEWTYEPSGDTDSKDIAATSSFLGDEFF